MRALVERGLLMTSFVTVVACSGRNKPPQDPYAAARTTTITSATFEATRTPKPKPPPMDPKPIDDTFGGGTNAGIDPTPTPEPPRLITDPEILAVTATAREAEIAMADLARRNAVDRDVKDYALMMSSEYRDEENKEKAVAKKAKLIAAESDASSKIQSDMDARVASLMALPPKKFDRTYLELQVKSLQQLLDAIDKQLLPSAQSGELKAHLIQLRVKVAGHLAKAQEIDPKVR